MKMLRQIGLALFAALVIGGASYVAPVVAQSIGVIVRAQVGVPNGPSISSASDTTSGLYFGTGYVGTTKHIAGGTGSAPSACTNCTAATGSDDVSGKFTTSSTTAGITFGTAWNTAPMCVLQPISSATQPTFRVLTTGLHADVVANSTVYNYFCRGVSGG
jgi:hypothetical protein